MSFDLLDGAFAGSKLGRNLWKRNAETQIARCQTARTSGRLRRARMLTLPHWEMAMVSKFARPTGMGIAGQS